MILGAGLCGLSAAHHLRGPCRVIEREHEVGGHARSRRRGGHTFDVTGHWLHLRDPAIRALVAALTPADAWLSVARRTRVFSHGELLPYPFQANLHGLPLAVVQECLVEFLAAREAEARGDHPELPRTFVEFAELAWTGYVAAVDVASSLTRSLAPQLDEEEADGQKD